MKNISEYLLSIEDGFVNLLHELSKFEKKFKPHHGLVVREPSRTVTAKVMADALQFAEATQNLANSEFIKFLEKNPELLLSMKAVMYDVGLTTNQLSFYIWVKKNTVSDYLNTIVYCFNHGLLVQSLVMVRATYEQIADTLLFMKDCDWKNISVNDIKLWTKRHDNFSKVLFKRFMATRINWENYALNSLKGAKKSSYKSPSQEFESHEAESILNSIDEFDKKIKGARRTYEFLCEFAHPNVGPYMLSRSKKSYVKKISPFPFIETIVSNQTPSDSIDYFKTHLYETYEILLEGIKLFDITMIKFEEILSIHKKESKAVLKRQIGNTALYWKSIEPCPCLSGDSIGLCCGKKIINTKSRI